MDAHWIFSGVFVLGTIWLVCVLKKKSKRCYACMQKTINGAKWTIHEPDVLRDLFGGEPGYNDLEKLEICPQCRRIYDERWFKRDWEMHDRFCACGFRLKSPWVVDPLVLKRMVVDLPNEVLQLFVQKLGRDDVAKFLGGYQDMLYRHDNLFKSHPFRVCEVCFRIYTWLEKDGFLFFRCVHPKSSVTDDKKMTDWPF